MVQPFWKTVWQRLRNVKYKVTMSLSNFTPNYIPKRNENIQDIHENKEKIIPTFVKMARKTLFGTTAICVKTIVVGEGEGAELQIQQK